MFRRVYLRAHYWLQATRVSSDEADPDRAAIETTRTKSSSLASRPEAIVRDPHATALTFLYQLEQPARSVRALHALTTPESHDAWGDFSGAAAGVASLGLWELEPKLSRPAGANDVAYAVVREPIDRVGSAAHAPVMSRMAIITMVWRQEQQRWLVHSLGRYVCPEDLPRSTGGVAPR